MNKKNTKWTADKIFSAVVSGGIIIALMFGVISIARSNQDNKTPQNYLDLNEEAPTNSGIAFMPEDLTQKSEKPSYQAPTTAPTEAPTKDLTEALTEAPTQAPSKANEQAVGNDTVKTKFSFKEDDTLLWPVKGDIVLKYSMDGTIWIPTLKSYRCNPAICIAAKEGSEVKAAASGYIEGIVNTQETGTNIIVNIGDGYKTIYGNVSNTANLKAGQTIQAGDTIGTVSKATIFYSETGDNLYFQLEKDGKAIDPVMFLE